MSGSDKEAEGEAEVVAAEETTETSSDETEASTEDAEGSETEDQAEATDESTGEDNTEDEPEAEAKSEDESSESSSDDEPGGSDSDSDAETEASSESESESEDGEQNEGPDESEDDRRQTGRKGVKLSRLIASKIIDGESQRDCYLHLVDISEGGLRINSDDPFPEDRQFTLEIGLAPFGTELATKSPRQAFPVKTVWSKSLVGGMVVSGLAFQDLDDPGKEVVAAIMQGASPQGRRMHFRLNRVLGVELGRDDEEQQWLYPLTLDLSVEGMRICLSEPLDVGSTFPIKVFLEFELPTVCANAEVMWQETMPSGRVQVGLKFDGMSERDAMAIKTYIDQCLRQDEAHRRL